MPVTVNDLGPGYGYDGRLGAIREEEYARSLGGEKQALGKGKKIKSNTLTLQMKFTWTMRAQRFQQRRF